MNFRFKTFLSFLRRNRLYTFVNVFGFAVSLMFVFVLSLYIAGEMTRDNYHPNKDCIYRLVFQTDYGDASVYSTRAAADLKNRYPEIESTLRMEAVRMQIFSDEGELFIENGALADTSFFRFFAYDFLEGDPAQAFRTNRDIVVSQSFARKVFGTREAIGQTLRIENQPYFITGVVRDTKHSHLTPFSVLMPFENLSVWSDNLNNWGNSTYGFYLMSREQTDFKAKIPEIEAYMTADERYWLLNTGFARNVRAEKLEDIYLSKTMTNAHQQSNDRRFLNILIGTALLILIFAVINYINLSVAQSGLRARESAIRRLLGGTRWQLFAGFTMESVLICLLSFLLSVGLATVCLPVFNTMLGADISVAELIGGRNLLTGTLGIVILGAITGIIPALMVSGFKPIEVVKGTFTRKTKMVYSRVLIAFQYCITIILIGCTIVIVRQIDYMKRTDVGFDKELLITFPNVFPSGRQAAVREELRGVAGVQSVSFADKLLPGNLDPKANMVFQDDDDNLQMLAVFYADTAYLSTMGLETLHRTDNRSGDGIWLNETGWKQMGLADDALSYTVHGSEMFRIAGKLRDFQYQDMSQPMGAAGIVLQENPDEQYAHVMVRITPGDPFGTLERVGERVNQLAGGNVFAGKFMDQHIQHLYREQDRSSVMLGSLAVLAIVISALGILAMATYFMQQRRKEVAVRKVFGAMNTQVLNLLITNFLRLVGIAFLVAVPFIWYIMNRWLAEYTYRISLTWDIFVLSGAIAFVIAALTVFFQSWRAANTNPVLAMRD